MKRIIWLLLLLSAVCWGQGNGYNSFQSSSFSGTASASAVFQNSLMLYHELIWTKTGTVSSCTVALDTSPDGVTWTAGGGIAGQTCTSNGTSVITNFQANYIRVTVTALGGGGTIGIVYEGWAFNPNPSGGGGSGVTQVNTGTGLTGGPITTTGTISLATNTANTLLGFNGSGNPADVTIGSGITLSGGILSSAITGGTCTNQAVTAISSVGVPTCTTITSAYVNNTIALTGTDINTSNQVTVTHLAAALPVNQGGTGTTTTLVGLMRGNAAAMTAAELSGDVTTSGSNVVTLATVNAGSGTCGDSTHVCQVVTNAKGLVTSQTAISVSGSGTVNTGTATHVGYYATSTTAISDAGADLTFDGTHTWATSASAILNFTATTLANFKTPLTTAGLVRTTTGGILSSAEISGDATTSGSLALTLATVNSGSGVCGDSTHVCQVTTNGKGLVTAQSAVAISGGGSPSLDAVTGAAAAATGTETSAGNRYTFAGVETTALASYISIKNTNSSNNNTSIGLLVGAEGTSTGGIGLVAYNVSGTGDIQRWYHGGSTSSGVYTIGTLEANLDNSGNLTILGQLTTGAGTASQGSAVITQASANYTGSTVGTLWLESASGKQLQYFGADSAVHQIAVLNVAQTFSAATTFSAGITPSAITMSSNGSSSAPILQGNGAASNTGLYFSSTSVWCMTSGGAINSCQGAGSGFEVGTAGNFTWSQTTSANGTAGANIGIVGSTTHEVIQPSTLLLLNSECKITTAITLSSSATTVCSFNMPSSGQSWLWWCDLGYNMTAGTTPTISIGMNDSQTPTSETGKAIITTNIATGAPVVTFGSSTATSSGHQNIVTSGTVTTGSEWPIHVWGTLTANAVAGTFVIDSTLAGASAAATITVGSGCHIE